MNVKIRVVVKEGLTQIEKYLLENPVIKQDLKILQKFRDELTEIDQITTNIGLEKLNFLITKEELSSDYNPYLQSHAQSMKAFEKTMQVLPEKIEDVPKEILQVPLQDIETTKKVQTVDTPQLEGVIDGKRKFDTVLKDLDRLKDKLGGSPNFATSEPRIDDALIEYFNAFKGVCFEDRAQKLEKFATEHPADSEILEAMEMVKNVIDTNKPAEVAFYVILEKMRQNKEKETPLNLLAWLRKDEIFDIEFLEVVKLEGEGDKFENKKIKPTLQAFQNYAIRQIEALVLDPYETIQDLLQMELEILKDSDQEVNAENFRNQLQKLEGKRNHWRSNGARRI